MTSSSHAKGGEAYLRDLPRVDIHRLDSGYFAVGDRAPYIAQKMIDFHARGGGLTLAPGSLGVPGCSARNDVALGQLHQRQRQHLRSGTRAALEPAWYDDAGSGRCGCLIPGAREGSRRSGKRRRRFNVLAVLLPLTVP